MLIQQHNASLESSKRHNGKLSFKLTLSKNYRLWSIGWFGIICFGV